ncbi:cilia- and flagella-associated protein 251-like [Montipora capricornis]|uniref:cilia- and flagella-associated protein 251-like n=1 Tax=Montipora capricornis TaxID=246305 RepID=UPI0035F1B9CC
MKGSGIIQVVVLLFSISILASAAPFANEIQDREEEINFDMPPFIPPKREETDSYSEGKDSEGISVRELAENEFPEPLEREFGHENEEEFFNRLERELAMETAKRKEEGSYRKELLNREVPGGYDEMPGEYEEDEWSEDDENEHDILNRELEEKLEENAMADEKTKREFGQGEDLERFRNPEEIYSREIPKENKENSNREFRGEAVQEGLSHKREASEDENEEEEEEEQEEERNYLREYLAENNESLNMELQDERINEEDDENREDTMEDKRRFMDERMRDHEDRMATPREMELMQMLSYPNGEFHEWSKKSENERLRELVPKRMREREAEREGQRLDGYGNKGREREELRERQRERALGEGRIVQEREMEGRKQREEKDPLGISREQRERFRFRSRSE